MRMAREVSNRELDVEEFKARALSMLNQYPELQGIAWLDERRRTKYSTGSAVAAANLVHQGGDSWQRRDHQSGFSQARELVQTVYVQRLRSSDDAPLLQIHIPLNERNRFSGVAADAG